MRASRFHSASIGFAPLVVVASVLAFALFGGFVVLLWNRLPKSETAEEARSKERLAKLVEVRERDARIIEAKEAAWIDKEKGIVAIPLERAMELVIREYTGGAPSATAVAVMPPAAPAAPTAAPATTPPAP